MPNPLLLEGVGFRGPAKRPPLRPQELVAQSLDPSRNHSLVGKDTETALVLRDRLFGLIFTLTEKNETPAGNLGCPFSDPLLKV